MMTRARTAAAGVLTLLVMSVGCSPTNPNAPCHVEGKVTYNNSPVGGGFVYFHGADGDMISLPIFANGTYSGDLKDGTYTVTVDTESLNPAKKQEYRGQGGSGIGYKMYGKAGAAYDAPPAAAPKGGAQASPAPDGAPASQGTYTKIPRKYADEGTSGLSVTLKRGKNEYNVPLTD